MATKKQSKKKRGRWLLDGEAVRRLAERRGIPVSELHIESGIFIDKRELYHWLRKERGISLQHLERLARRLGVGIPEIATFTADEPSLPKDAGDLLSNEQAWQAHARRGASLRQPASLIVSYLQNIRLSCWGRAGYIREFVHDGTWCDRYAEVILVPVLDEGQSGRQRFVFAFEFGGFTVEYGEVILTQKGNVRLSHYFQNWKKSSRAAAGGMVKVGTWFGQEPCEFSVRSDRDFTLRVQMREVGTELPDTKNDENLVWFPAAPHHGHR